MLILPHGVVIFFFDAAAAADPLLHDQTKRGRRCVEGRGNSEQCGQKRLRAPENNTGIKERYVFTGKIRVFRKYVCVAASPSC